MLIYNVTVKVEAAIAGQWLHWLVEEHAPEMLATLCFHDFSVLRLLDMDDTEGPTFAIQYKVARREDYERYLSLHADDLRKKSLDKWGARMIAFRTLMEVVK